MLDTEIILVRHAESTSNVAQRWQGHGDAPLSVRGRAQAAALAAAMTGERIDRVVSSDLARAHDTARALGRPVEAHPDWRELDLGAWDGLTSAEIAARFPGQLEALRTDPDHRLGGGESWRDLARRAGGALERLRATLEPGARAVVVAHGAVIVALLEDLLGVAPTHPRRFAAVRNTARARLRWRDGGVTLATFNEVDHLGADAPPHRRPEGAHALHRLQPGAPRRDAVSDRVDRWDDPDRLADGVARDLGIHPARGRLAPLGAPRAAHLVVSRLGTSLLDWGVTPR